MKITAITAGTKITMHLGPCAYGHVAAPSDGLLIEDGEHSVFVPADEVREKLAELPRRRPRLSETEPTE